MTSDVTACEVCAIQLQKKKKRERNDEVLMDDEIRKGYSFVMNSSAIEKNARCISFRMV